MPLFKDLNIGYAPANNSLFDEPSDYRRFAGYAKLRGFKFEIANHKKKYDLVVVNQMADISIWKNYPHGKVIYDLIDSYLAIPDWNYRSMFRGISKFIFGQNQRLCLDYKRCIQDMCTRSDAVICVTEQQKLSIEPYCSNVFTILDVQDSVVTSKKNNYKITSPVKLVWEGLPDNMYQLLAIRDILNNLNNEFDIELHIVTNPTGYRFLGKYGKFSSIEFAKNIFHNTVFHIWEKETFSSIVSNCDIAIIPIDLENPFTMGKPENKLLLLWRVGMPVIVSNTPAYAKCMERAGMDLVCSSIHEWEEKLRYLITNIHARENSGVAGRDYVNQNVNQESILNSWDTAIDSILG
jgi:hypothetical protein